MYIKINGKFYTKDKAKVSVLDRGFLYGDGVFETMRVYNGHVFALNEHLARLRNSAKTILLKIIKTDEEIKNELIKTLKKNKLKNAILRISFSRGRGWGLNLKGELKPSMVILCRAFHPYPEEFYKKGVDVIISKKVVSYSGSVLNRVKSTNYIPNILAKNEADDTGAFDALTVDEKGYILEGSVSNFFIVKKGVLITAPLKTGILPGITREIVLKLAKMSGIKIEEKKFKPELIYKADEAFLTNTSIEVLPVKIVNGKIINKGRMGGVTLKLLNKFRDAVKE
ncbi:MAG: aminotransferase class IV [bacterium]|nr:aminotransferase class IV [bacterium]